MMILKGNTSEGIIMKNNTHQTKWIIDAGLFAGFLIASLLDLTGLAVHQWLGLAVGVLAGYHLLAHWRWVKSVTQRWFGRTSGQARRFYLIDASLLAGFSLILLSGLVISTWFDLSLASYAAWRSIHLTVTIMTLALVVVKIGLHWRWIVKVGGRMLQGEATTEKRAISPQFATVKVNSERRDFLKLMGVVSLAALVAGYSALESEEASATQSAGTAQEVSQPASAPESNENDASASQCSVRCNRGCSYPGHCRRYVDSNQNNRCDYGECA
jgi:hypothetical protein